MSSSLVMEDQNTFKGLMYVKLDSIAKGCEYLKKAADLNFSGNASETVYIRFCN